MDNPGFPISVNHGLPTLLDNHEFLILLDNHGFTILLDNHGFQCCWDHGSLILLDNHGFLILLGNHGFLILLDNHGSLILLDNHGFLILLDNHGGGPPAGRCPRTLPPAGGRTSRWGARRCLKSGPGRSQGGPSGRQAGWAAACLPRAAAEPSRRIV